MNGSPSPWTISRGPATPTNLYAAAEGGGEPPYGANWPNE